ncbi:MAG TPA: cytochrome P450 [Roseiflexaceae bacterium]|nr:cytochrome P450 [Roseiflexaceae bacterium]
MSVNQHNFDFPRFAPPYLNDPYPLYRAAPPVFFDPATQLWFITRYTDVQAALRKPELFSSSFPIRTPINPSPEVQAVLDEAFPEEMMLVNQNPPDHTRIRRLVAPAFGPRRRALLEDAIQQLVDRAIDRIVPDGSADLVTALAVSVPLEVICTLMGLPLEHAERIKFWTGGQILLTAYTSDEQRLEGARRSVEFQRYLERQIHDRRASPRDDLISDLVHAEIEPGVTLTDSQLVSLLISVVFAGHETTTNLIGMALRHTLPDRNLWAALGEQPGLAEAVVDETLRFDSPFQGMFRLTTAPAEVAGVTIPQGAMVFLLFGAANRDPAVFNEPDRFDPARPNRGAHLSLGYGIHYCVGAALALSEARVALATLARCLPAARLDEPEPPFAPHLMHRGPLRLLVRWD